MLLASVVANCTTAAALLVKSPSGTRGPQGPGTLGRVGLGSPGEFKVTNQRMELQSYLQARIKALLQG